MLEDDLLQPDAAPVRASADNTVDELKYEVDSLYDKHEESKRGKEAFRWRQLDTALREAFAAKHTQDEVDTMLDQVIISTAHV